MTKRLISALLVLAAMGLMVAMWGTPSVAQLPMRGVEAVGHISSTTHVVGSVYVTSLAGAAVTVTGTALDVNCTGCAAASTVAVSHVSAMLHVAVVDLPRWAHLAAAQSGSWAVTAHATGSFPVSAGQSGAWTIQGAHQAGEWNVRHIGAMVHAVIVDLPRWAHVAVSHAQSVTHVAAAGGGLVVRDDTCTTCRLRVDHYNALVVQPHISGAFNTWQVNACGTTARIVVASNPNRRDLYVQNLGGPTASAGAHSNVYLGLGVTGHVALTAANGWVLHAMTRSITPATTSDTARVMTGGGDSSKLILYNYQGPLSCVAVTTGPLGATLGILEILR